MRNLNIHLLDGLILSSYLLMGPAFSGTKNICDFNNSMHCYYLFSVVAIAGFLTSKIVPHCFEDKKSFFWISKFILFSAPFILAISFKF